MVTVSSGPYGLLQIIASVIHLIGASVLGFCLSRRIPPLNRWEPWKHLTWGRACIILVLLDSWIFVIFSGILSTGVGLAESLMICQMAILVCIICYGSTKLFIYAFLVEKVYIVWSCGNQTPRFKTPVYRICCGVLTGYAVVLVLMVLGRKSLLNEDRVCLLGLEGFATIPLVAYDLAQNVFFTAMFLWPFWRSHPMSPRLRAVAKRTLYAACGSLTVSAVNYLVMVALHGQELGWICLVGCVTDVTLNAIFLFWVSSSGSSPTECRDRFSLPRMDMTALTFPFPDLEATTASGSALATVRGATTTTTSTTVPMSQKSPTLVKFPDEMFDYIPSDHRNNLQGGGGEVVDVIVIDIDGVEDTDTRQEEALAVDPSEKPQYDEDSSRSTR
ncbi:hypothetical protein L218DRAFT_310640 [Marasmius fiardii PR-910]|nr:hypothetical protein L218DRAFT_310640 [Marasmius fiardii PR-910]